MNALALSVNSGVRAFSPAVGTAIFAAGVRTGFLHGHLVFVIFFFLGCGLIVACNYNPDNAEGKPKKAEQSTTDENEE